MSKLILDLRVRMCFVNEETLTDEELPVRMTCSSIISVMLSGPSNPVKPLPLSVASLALFSASRTAELDFASSFVSSSPLLVLEPVLLLLPPKLLLDPPRPTVCSSSMLNGSFEPVPLEPIPKPWPLPLRPELDEPPVLLPVLWPVPLLEV